MLDSLDFDIAVNVASMQEMAPATVAAYFTFLRQRLRRANLFYCCNRESKRLAGGDLSEFARYPWRPDDSILVDGPCPWHQYFHSRAGEKATVRDGCALPLVAYYDGSHCTAWWCCRRSGSARKRVVAVVPARMASSRFPGKPLVSIAGLPMVEHVRRRALLAAGVDEVVVATCDTSIFQAVTAAGGRALMTRDTHERCTDRVAEAMESLDGNVVAIVQGDEPLLLPGAVEAVIKPLVEHDDVVCTNLLSPLESDEDLANPNIVKAVCALDGRVMFLSRAPIPHFRRKAPCPVYRQTGILALTADFLRVYTTLSETPFERAESVDMLRVLEHGFPITGVVLAYSTVGVDRTEDVPVVERVLESDPVQRDLLARTKG